MRTDFFFFRLFIEAPRLFFQIIGETGIDASNYKFISKEIKEQSFRFDGIFEPKSKKLPVYFVEMQFQKDNSFYSRFFSEIFLYLHQVKPQGSWKAVVIYPSRKIDTGIHKDYKEFWESGILEIIYIDEIDTALLNHYPVSLLKLITSDDLAFEKNLIQISLEIEENEKSAEEVSLLKEIVMRFVTTNKINYSKEKVMELMNLLIDEEKIKKSRFIKDFTDEAKLEGKLEGKLEDAQKMFENGISIDLIKNITGLEYSQLNKILK